MALPKKGSRKIVVNNIAYRWLIRRKATYSQIVYGIGKLHVAIELYDNPMSTLVIFTDRPHPQDIGGFEIIAITPSDIQNWIEQAIHLNWKPSQNGSQFQVTIKNGLMESLS